MLVCYSPLLFDIAPVCYSPRGNVQFLNGCFDGGLTFSFAWLSFDLVWLVSGDLLIAPVRMEAFLGFRMFGSAVMLRFFWRGIGAARKWFNDDHRVDPFSRYFWLGFPTNSKNPLFLESNSGKLEWKEQRKHLTDADYDNLDFYFFFFVFEKVSHYFAFFGTTNRQDKNEIRIWLFEIPLHH